MKKHKFKVYIFDKKSKKLCFIETNTTKEMSYAAFDKVLKRRLAKSKLEKEFIYGYEVINEMGVTE